MSTSREVDNETMTGVNSRFAEVTENDILRMQDIAIPNDTKKHYSDWVFKKIQASAGFEPVTSAIPVQCSTN